MWCTTLPEMCHAYEGVRIQSQDTGNVSTWKSRRCRRERGEDVVWTFGHPAIREMTLFSLAIFMDRQDLHSCLEFSD